MHVVLFNKGKVMSNKSKLKNEIHRDRFKRVLKDKLVIDDVVVNLL